MKELTLWTDSFLLGVLFVALTLVLTLTKRFELTNRWLVFLRALFPSWRFFEDVTELPRLLVRIAPSEEFREWNSFGCSPARSLFMIVFNPRGNVTLAIGSLLQQIEADIAELEPERVSSFEESTSFKLLRSIVSFSFRKSEILTADSQIQFKLVRVTQGQPLESGEEFLISKEYRWGEFDCDE